MIFKQCFSIAITQDAHVMPLIFRYALFKSSSGTNILNILLGASTVLSFNETLNFVANDDIADTKSEGFMFVV